MAEKKDDLKEVSDDDRKLSIPNSVQRRKFGSLGTYSRVVVCAVDASERAKIAFFCKYQTSHVSFSTVNVHSIAHSLLVLLICNLSIRFAFCILLICDCVLCHIIED